MIRKSRVTYVIQVRKIKPVKMNNNGYTVKPFWFQTVLSILIGDMLGSKWIKKVNGPLGDHFLSKSFFKNNRKLSELWQVSTSRMYLHLIKYFAALSEFNSKVSGMSMWRKIDFKFLLIKISSQHLKIKCLNCLT